MPASFNKSDNNHQHREQLPEGTYAARCYGCCELGQQTQEWQGEVKVGHEILFFFEIPSETITYEKDGETITAPRVINLRLKNSMHEKAKMRAVLGQWRGKPFSDEDAVKFSPDRVLGSVCQLSVAHNKKGYAHIASIAPLMKGIEVAVQVNPMINFGIGDLNNPEEFGKLYPWVQKIVMESGEAKKKVDIPVIQLEEDDDSGQIPF